MEKAKFDAMIKFVREDANGFRYILRKLDNYEACGAEYFPQDAVINLMGEPICYSAAVSLMDDDLREKLANKLAPCTEQEFFTAYEKAHEKKFGEEWELSKANLCW